MEKIGMLLVAVMLICIGLSGCIISTYEDELLHRFQLIVKVELQHLSNFATKNL